jgi:hypothetical protein
VSAVAKFGYCRAKNPPKVGKIQGSLRSQVLASMLYALDASNNRLFEVPMSQCAMVIADEIVRRARQSFNLTDVTEIIKDATDEN